MLKGALVALVTPFRDGKVDEDTLRELVEFHIANGTNGIVPCGTTGESATLSHDEHRMVIRSVVEQVAKRVPVVAGTGSNNTAEAIELTLFAKGVGADAALLIAPYYNKPTQEGLYRHFEAIAKATKFPLVPYNIMGRTAVNIEPATMARIAELPEVVAVKEASGNLGQMAEIVNLCGDKMALLSGDDGLLLPVLAIGGVGVVSVVNNIVPRQVVDIIEAWNAGDIALSQQRFHKLLPLCKAMFLETNPIPIKAAMAMVGRIPSDEMRLPMCPIGAAAREKLSAALRAHGLL
ncbi:dihydrodipicolinate synthase [Desulfarculus baarsii DSM 2075]|uniref:4-hydroxy-tetrahydrodipicolinate synthase n=1 Tax=Desulfarculus baarsii (strain ATCC 33931 / DSM 2075 / LMG 7858 / VKM B-1802 / 2st14) TaxID=644282 RepID=E1QI48_DESB2|nr:4-hydroxy-tetrahydrodipicolinate synthase [Desulfarculus baarsii]ADK85241.1 dihydrodipicolinate synthase [Desulfarculus baarsii DSM 2075]